MGAVLALLVVVVVVGGVDGGGGADGGDVAWYRLFAVGCLLFIVSCLLLVVCCWLCVGCLSLLVFLSWHLAECAKLYTHTVITEELNANPTLLPPIGF